MILACVDREGRRILDSRTTSHGDHRHTQRVSIPFSDVRKLVVTGAVYPDGTVDRFIAGVIAVHGPEEIHSLAVAESEICDSEAEARRSIGVDLEALRELIAAPTAERPWSRADPETARWVLTIKREGLWRYLLAEGRKVLAQGVQPFATLWFLCLAVVAAGFGYVVMPDVAIRAAPVAVQGTVLGVEIDYGATYRDAAVGDGWPRRIDFAYERDGAAFTRRIWTQSEAVLAAAKPGAVIAVETALWNAEWARIAGTRIKPAVPDELILLPLAFVLVVAIAVVRAIVRVLARAVAVARAPDAKAARA